MNLISMTDFVFLMRENTEKDNIRRFWACERYAKFLKQPLTLGMFIPCDYEGNYWKYPPTIEEWEWVQKDSADAEQSFRQKEFYYNQSLNKILFEGFTLIGNTVDNINGNCFFTNYLKGRTVEDLLHMNLTLTKSAIKQIGLK